MLPLRTWSDEKCANLFINQKFVRYTTRRSAMKPRLAEVFRTQRHGARNFIESAFSIRIRSFSPVFVLIR